ncbi:uncharacterized [Tachysurus ichikawai]
MLIQLQREVLSPSSLSFSIRSWPILHGFDLVWVNLYVPILVLFPHRDEEGSSTAEGLVKDVTILALDQESRWQGFSLNSQLVGQSLVHEFSISTKV